MAYQYVREPLRSEEADKLCHACETTQDKLIVWVLLDTGLRVGELCSLKPDNILRIKNYPDIFQILHHAIFWAFGVLLVASFLTLLSWVFFPKQCRRGGA